MDSTSDPKTIEDVQVIEMPIIDSLHPRPDYLPLSFPKDLSDRLLRLHGDPTVWWIGQFIKYLTRPQDHLKQELERAKQKLGFTGPIVGWGKNRAVAISFSALLSLIWIYTDKCEAFMNFFKMFYKLHK